LHKKPILLGAIYNLHGSQASLDIASAHGLELAVEELNKTGGIHDRQIKLMLLDGYSNPDSIKKAATMLIKHKVSAVIGFSDTDMVLAAGQIISNAGIPFITSGATAPILVESIPRVLFLSCFGDNVQAAAGAEFAKTKLEKNNVFIIYNKSMDYAKFLAAYFKKSWLEMRGGIADELFYDHDATDSTRIVNSLIRNTSEYDFIYLAAGPDEIGYWIRLIRKAGIKQTIIGGDGYDTPLLTAVAGQYANNVYFTTHAWMSSKGNTDKMKEFYKSYHSKYGVDPENSFAALGYDAAFLFADAAARAKNLKPANLLESLQNTSEWNGLTGKVRYIDGSHIPMKEVTIIGINDSTPFLDAVIIPDKIPAP